MLCCVRLPAIGFADAWLVSVFCSSEACRHRACQHHLWLLQADASQLDSPQVERQDFHPAAGDGWQRVSRFGSGHVPGVMSSLVRPWRSEACITCLQMTFRSSYLSSSFMLPLHQQQQVPSSLLFYQGCIPDDQGPMQSNQERLATRDSCMRVLMGTSPHIRVFWRCFCLCLLK